MFEYELLTMEGSASSARKKASAAGRVQFSQIHLMLTLELLFDTNLGQALKERAENICVFEVKRSNPFSETITPSVFFYWRRAPVD